MLLVATTLLRVVVGVDCQSHCRNPCSDLSGDPSAECAACTADFQCNPAASDYAPPSGHSEQCVRLLKARGARGRFGQSTLLFNGSASELPPYRSDGCVDDTSLRAECSGPESTARLRERGWVVLRGLMPAEEAAALTSTVPIESQCTPQIETCHLTRAQMAQRLPRFVANVGRVFAEWERSGLAAEAGLGSGMALAEVGTARPIWVTTDATFRRLVGEGVEPKVATARAARRYEGGRSSSNWHVDSSGGDGYHGHTHRMWTLLHKRGGEGANAHGNLCVVPTAAVDACDSPRFRSAVGRGAMDVFDRLACCPHLDVGDTIFYREDVIHGTQDKLVDRLGMSITISGDGPRPLRDGEPAPEDPRCAAWAADGLCTPSTAVPVAAAASSSPAVSVGDRMGSAEDHEGMLVRCLCERSCGAMSTAT